MTALKAKTTTQLLSVSTRDKPNDDYEKMQFYYHPDHLGSSSYITNLNGEVSQHIEYVPFGEPFIEERNKTRAKISWRMIIFNKKMMLFLKRQLISNRLSKGLADLLKEGITVN